MTKSQGMSGKNSVFPAGAYRNIQSGRSAKIVDWNRLFVRPPERRAFCALHDLQKPIVYGVKAMKWALKTQRNCLKICAKSGGNRAGGYRDIPKAKGRDFALAFRQFLREQKAPWKRAAMPARAQAKTLHSCTRLFPGWFPWEKVRKWDSNSAAGGLEVSEYPERAPAGKRSSRQTKCLFVRKGIPFRTWETHRK